ncbi:hypothetical protein [Aestuariispira ectoiniformans]|uniref:hypothetical protein n=1 Tax=Aestuariispira ectoiniformans TaxID=2775080 RepID=UPI00223B5414|nr:hypothetical protein [Aestuariispira ectoiniformans]
MSWKIKGIGVVALMIAVFSGNTGVAVAHPDVDRAEQAAVEIYDLMLASRVDDLLERSVLPVGVDRQVSVARLGRYLGKPRAGERPDVRTRAGNVQVPHQDGADSWLGGNVDNFDLEELSDDLPLWSRVRVDFRTATRGTAVFMMKTPDGWKADFRYALEHRRLREECKDTNGDGSFPPGCGPEEPEARVRAFLYYSFQCRKDKLAEIVTDPDLIDLENCRSTPGADRGHVAQLALEMVVTRTLPDEAVVLAGGYETKVNPNRPDRMLLRGVFGAGDELGFEVVKVDGKWKVVPVTVM